MALRHNTSHAIAVHGSNPHPDLQVMMRVAAMYCLCMKRVDLRNVALRSQRMFTFFASITQVPGLGACTASFNHLTITRQIKMLTDLKLFMPLMTWYTYNASVTLYHCLWLHISR